MSNFNKPKVDILILVHNEEKFLGVCLKNLKQQRLLNNIIVIDDFSTDNSGIIAKKHNAIVIRAEKPIAERKTEAAEMLNYGLKFIKTKYFLKLDADIILEKDYIYNCVEYIEKRKRIYSVSGVIPPLYPRWLKNMTFIYQIYPRGGARLYNTKILNKIGGFTCDPIPVINPNIGRLIKRNEDTVTDKIAFRLNFFKGISRKSIGWHLREAKQHLELNTPNRYEKMFFLLLFLKFDQFNTGLKIIKKKIQQLTFNELILIIKREIKSLIARLLFRIIESEETKMWIKNHLKINFPDLKF